MGLVQDDSDLLDAYSRRRHLVMASRDVRVYALQQPPQGCEPLGGIGRFTARFQNLRTPGRPPARHRERVMSEHVYKFVELVGSSTTSSDDAIHRVIETAAKTLRHIDWFEVIETRGHVKDGKVAHFQVTVKVGFRLEG